MAKVNKNTPHIATIQKHLKKDPILAQIMTEEIEDKPNAKASDIYNDLLDAIISQQLSTKAAAIIKKRVRQLFPDNAPDPDKILNTKNEVLRNAGLSFQKIKYIKNIATAIKEKTLRIETFHERDDESIITELTKIQGIGRWTAEMILIFSLKRQDIFPISDRGIRKAIAKLYNIDENDRKKIINISNAWSPYRSYASKYLWKSLDNMPKNEK